MPKPTCVQCRLFFRPKRNGVCIEEGIPNSDGTWASYKLWDADLWECKGCGAQIVTGYGRAPLAEYYQATYADDRARFAPLFRVDDC
jgi:hypothetical protein